MNESEQTIKLHLDDAPKHYVITCKNNTCKRSFILHYLHQKYDDRLDKYSYDITQFCEFEYCPECGAKQK